MSKRFTYFNSFSSINPNFISTWNTANSGSAGNTVVLPLISSGTYSFDVDWGDGNVDTITAYNQSEITHTYTTGGIYTVTITGDISGWQMGTNNRDKITDISSWGTLGITTNTAFQLCTNLDISATNAPTLTGTDLNQMFNRCYSLTTPDFSNWDVLGVLNMQGMFFNCTNFNGDVTTWDTSTVTNMKEMFSNTTAFNQNIDGWDVSSVATMQAMFRTATAFNQNLNSWNVGSVTTMGAMFQNSTVFNGNISNWNFSSVTNAQQMFQNSSFNQDIGGWNTSLCINMLRMLDSIPFDQDISLWDINQVSNFVNFMNGTTLSTANYDALLIAWDAQGAMSYSGTVNFGGSKYTSGGAAEAARTSLISKWGGIVDGGAA